MLAPMRSPELRQTVAGVLFVGAVAFLNLQEPRAHGGFIEVDAAQAKALIATGALAIDVRERAASDGSHLPGALRIPLGELPASLARIQRARVAAKATPIVVYCDDGSRLGPEAAQVLARAGYAQVLILKPGIEGWRRAGLPTARS